MRIAVVTTSYPHFEGDPSGHFVEAEVQRMAQRGEEVVVITPRGSAYGAAFGWPGAAAKLSARPWRAVAAAAWVLHARRELARRGPFDRVIAHWAIPCALPICAGSSGIRGRMRAPLEVVSHGGDVRLLCALPRGVRARVTRAIAARAETWRFVSEALLAELVTVLPAEDAARVRAVARVEACAIAMPDVSDAIAAKRRALGGAKVAACVGRLVASKRVDAAIAHAARQKRDLVIVGDGPERARLEALAAKVARESGVRVTFVGKVAREEALAWIGAADEVLHASRAEGASTVLREAEALGVRVVAIS